MLEIIKQQKLSPSDPEDVSVQEAISTIYQEMQGWMFYIDWDGFSIPLDGTMLSSIYPNVIEMMKKLENNIPHFNIFFLDNSFTTEWRFGISGQTLEIRAMWTSAIGYSSTDGSIDKLRNKEILITNKETFMNEWKDLLKVIKFDIIRAGYDNNIQGFKELEIVCD